MTTLTIQKDRTAVARFEQLSRTRQSSLRVIRVWVVWQVYLLLSVVLPCTEASRWLRDSPLSGGTVFGRVTTCKWGGLASSPSPRTPDSWCPLLSGQTPSALFRLSASSSLLLSRHPERTPLRSPPSESFHPLPLLESHTPPSGSSHWERHCIAQLTYPTEAHTAGRREAGEEGSLQTYLLFQSPRLCSGYTGGRFPPELTDVSGLCEEGARASHRLRHPCLSCISHTAALLIHLQLTTLVRKWIYKDECCLNLASSLPLSLSQSDRVVIPESDSHRVPDTRQWSLCMRRAGWAGALEYAKSEHLWDWFLVLVQGSWLTRILWRRDSTS